MFVAITCVLIFWWLCWFVLVISCRLLVLNCLGWLICFEMVWFGWLFDLGVYLVVWVSYLFDFVDYLVVVAFVGCAVLMFACVYFACNCSFGCVWG